ncbi:DUF4224 domain-containing protein [Duganella sp. Root198D2]|uniref:DUF4224 domain-containing protein n=1 Tax=Duganella sp. Root198D2 TaxID=1736489 RepID=UPI0035A377AB
MFELPLHSETLSADELIDISGSTRKNDQIDWLKRNGWVFHQNRAGSPVIGRLYARMRLAGINPTAIAMNDRGWNLDTSKVR